MAVNFVLSGTSPGGKALVVCTDLSRFALADAAAIQEWAYSEPSSGAGAVAMLVSDQPHILRLDAGAYGNHGFEVMDTCRPGPDTEAGDADLFAARRMYFAASSTNCRKSAFVPYSGSTR